MRAVRNQPWKGYRTEAQALALRFKADWEIWSNLTLSRALLVTGLERKASRECSQALDNLPCIPQSLAYTTESGKGVAETLLSMSVAMTGPKSHHEQERSR